MPIVLRKKQDPDKRFEIKVNLLLRLQPASVILKCHSYDLEDCSSRDLLC